jgi:hypothetical protein
MTRYSSTAPPPDQLPEEGHMILVKHGVRQKGVPLDREPREDFS